MIVYHINGRVIATHADHQDAPAGSYPGTTRKVLPNSAAALLTVGDDGIETMPPELTAPSAADVRAEAQRRIIALVGASSLDACVVKQLNALMRANELIKRRVWFGSLTAEEEAEAAALQELADRIEAIRAASNAMEASPPDDFASDARW